MHQSSYHCIQRCPTVRWKSSLRWNAPQRMSAPQVSLKFGFGHTDLSLIGLCRSCGVGCGDSSRKCLAHAGYVGEPVKHFIFLFVFAFVFDFVFVLPMSLTHAGLI